MDRTVFRLRTYWLSFVLLISTSLPCLAAAQSTAPNIILIVSDYMGYADIEPYGAKDIRTPALSRLAAQGVKFNDHYAAAPSCIPSRASLLSGLYPQHALSAFSKTRGRGLASTENRLLQTLKAQQYNTAAIGKWHLGLEPDYHPNDHGFDYFFGFDSWTLDYYSHKTSDGEPGLFENRKPVDKSGYLTDVFVDQALTYINSQSAPSSNHNNAARTPYFLYLSFNTGLPPYQAPNLPESQQGNGWDENEAHRSDYVAMVEQMDKGIGRILNAVDKSVMTDNTIVIFTYDHGGRHLVNSGDLFHGFGTLWEGGIRVPLIISWPAQLGQSDVIEIPTIAMDITTTLINAAIVDPQPSPSATAKKLAGVDLLDLIETPTAFITRPLFWSARGMTAIRQGDWKYVVDGHSQLLFNLKRDISERKNLFYQQPKQVYQLKQQLNDWQDTN